MHSSALEVFQFGPFRLDVFERTLVRDGEVIPLFGKAFDTLVALVDGAGSLQEQQALIDRIWPNVIVEPNSLQQNISLVRRALAGADDVKIETVRGRGYRLLANVHKLSATASAPTPIGAGNDPERDSDLPSQRTHFCSAHDGARLAYALLGNGRPPRESRQLVESPGARSA